MGNVAACPDACCWSAVYWLASRGQGELFVFGFPRRAQSRGDGASANGAYRVTGEHHGRPVFARLDKGPFVYFWDARDGPSWCGWWLGPIVGGAEVWGYNPEPAALPPSSGWRSPWQGPASARIRMTLKAGVAARFLAAAPVQEEVPEWLRNPGHCEAIREEPQLLQSCSICLEPLWDAEPSVFVVNLRRLCPHYFCSRCAKRIVVEQTTMGLQNFKEDQRVGSVDGLASVLDAEGNRLGDLVWGESGQRLSDGELFLVLTQLERLVELEVGMELRGKDSDALVLRQGALFGCLLHAQRSLRRYTAQELDAEGLDGAMLVEGNLEPLRRRCVVYRGGDVVCWHCPRCSLENSSSDFRCKLCGAPPSCPRELPAPRPLGVHGVAALRTRFALRPQLHWAMPLQCPLCRLGGTAFVAHMPKLREAPAEWFSMVSKGQDQISLSELAAGLAVVLPLSPERLQQELQRFPAPMNYAAFVAEGGPAHWAAGQLAALTATGREPGICDAV
ncbi:unnamed protein product [Effrenium voratum]|nr:unnamed protein product [Effrenium voratum]